MEEENNTNFNAAPKKGGSKKPLIICLSIILVLAIVAVIVGLVLMKSGKLNLSKKAKMQAGVDQLTESLLKPLDDINNAIESNDLSIKVLNNISKGDAIAVNADFSASIDNIEVPDMDPDEEKVLDAVKELLNNSSLGLNAQYDGKEKLYGNATLTMDGNSISAEGLYDGEKVAFRSKELNETWLSTTKKDLLAQMNITESDLTKADNAINSFMNNYAELMKKADIDEKTAEEIEKRYKDVLKDFVNSKEKSINSEKTKVTVDGKEKSCDKLTLKLNQDDIKKLAKKYIEAFKKDEQTQKIIKDYLEQYEKSMTQMANDLGASSYELRQFENLASQFERVLDELDTVSDQIDKLDFEVTVKLVVYATNTEVYKTEISGEYNGASIKLETTFSGNKSTTEISVSEKGQTIDVGTLEMESDNGSGRIKFEASQMVSSLAKAEKIVFECSYKLGGKSEEVNLNFDMGSKIGNGKVSVVSNINRNDDNAFECDSKVSIDTTIADEVKLKGSFKTNIGIKVGSESIPTVANTDTADINVPTEIEKYKLDTQTKGQDLIKKFSDNKTLNNLFEVTTGKTLKELIEELENGTGSTPQVTPPVILTPPTLPPTPEIDFPNIQTP